MDALGLLALQIEWGADEALAELPVPKLAVPKLAVPQLPAGPAATPAPAPRHAPQHKAPQPAAEIVAGTLDALCAAIRDFPGCALRVTATNPVLPEGDPAGRLLIIGEPPGAEDDRAGRPFSGPAGAVLDRILAAIGLARENILLAPLIPWRPPGNRPPTDAELAQCLPLLHRLIVLAQPRHIMLTGILPVRALLGSTVSLRRQRGQWLDLTLPDLPAPIPTLLSLGLGNLRSATERREAWADWRMLHRNITPESS